MYAYKNEIETTSDDPGVYVGGATNGKKAVLAISNPSDRELECELSLSGVNTADVDIFITDDDFTYLDSGRKIKNGKITLSPWSCVEVRMERG